MLPNSFVFLVFVAIVALICQRLDRRKQNAFLLVASYYFYGYYDWRFGFLIIGSTALDFLVAKRIFASRDPRRKRLLLLVSVVLNLSALGLFKYFNFFIDSTSTLLRTLGLNPHFPVLQIILPIGISFYTFRTLSYTVDVYRGRLSPADSFVDYALFVSFFPQLLAGPIERASNLLPQFQNRRTVTTPQIVNAFSLIILGYFKKIAIADTLAPLVDKCFGSPSTFSSGELLSGMYAFTFQIYGDFSGYSDIARGIALLLGFTTVENFRTPYFSKNVTEFWHRWHISLSSWLRDYLYISLGGNRRGKARSYINLMTTMLLGGLWHGAAWTFMVWGAAHGVYLCIHKFLFGKNRQPLLPSGPARWVLDGLKILFTFHVVAFTWIAFKSKDFATLLAYVKGILRFESIFSIDPAVIFACCMVVVLDVMQVWQAKDTWLLDRKIPLPLRYIVTQILLLSAIAAAIAHANTVTPFIYFQF